MVVSQIFKHLHTDDLPNNKMVATIKEKCRAVYVNILIVISDRVLIAKLMEYDISVQGNDLEQLRERLILTIKGSAMLNHQKGKHAFDKLEKPPVLYQDRFKQGYVMNDFIQEIDLEDGCVIKMEEVRIVG